MMDNKVIESVMEYVRDKRPKPLQDYICSAKKDTITGVAHYW